MSQRGKTKDELFMITLYETAERSGSVFNPVNRFEIGRLIGMHEKGLQTICRTLLQSNFIKKRGEKDVVLTELGKSLVLGFLER